MEKVVWTVIELTIYDIIYIVGAVALYTVILALGVTWSVKEHKKIASLLFTLKDVIDELKSIVTREENEVDKGSYKSTRSSEYINKSEVQIQMGLVNRLSLSNLLNNKPTNFNYNEVIAMLTQLAKKTYEEYKFFIARSTDETQQANFLQIVSHSSEEPELHKRIFAKAVDSGMDIKELQQRFAEHVATGNVIDLGEDVVVILNDGGPQLATGVSPVNNGLEGGEIAFIISFIKKENLEAFNKNNLPQEEAAADE
jgi:hypothetical protein